jgi:3-oxoacyl-(acyl-carrier-protein) synthase
MTRVVATGMGIISAIGNNLNENFDRLHKGKSGIGKARHFESAYTATLPFGEVGLSNEELKQLLKIEEDTGYTRTTLLAIKAFEECVSAAGLTPEEISSKDTAFISASTVGGMCLTDQLYEDANMRSEGSEYLSAYGCAAHTLQLVERYKICGFTDTINTACSSSANAIMLGARLIRSGRAKRAIVGGVDSLAKYTVNGFNALKILSEFPSKPFDANRDGLNLGEAAAYLVLEAEDVANGKHIYATVAGYGNANDAHHPSAMSDEALGAIASMRQALGSANVVPGQIGYINAHGTGTPNNDQVELVGIKDVFGGNVPLYNSTKSYTGHTLGAAGAVEAVYSILFINHEEICAGLNVESPLDENIPSLSVLKQKVKLDYVLSNSFGFGGNCTSLLLGKYHKQ